MTRIVHVSESDLQGGASLSAYRIHRALVEAGIDSRFLVSQKFSDDPTVAEIFPRRGLTLRRRLMERLDELPLWRYRRRPAPIFSLNWAPNRVSRVVNAAQPTIVHLHWINHGLLPLRDFKRLAAPLVWNLWDQWPFTGGCHYSGACERFANACGACPALASTNPRDLSYRTLAEKHRRWRGLRFEVVAPSEWLAMKARASSLFANQSCSVLPQPVDTRVFRPVPAAQARSLLGLDPDAQIIVMGADKLGEARKGFDLVEAALRPARFGTAHPTLLCTFGDRPASPPERLGDVAVRHLGRLRDELTVTLAYCAADVAIVPSREDAGPQVTVEALACGTPVVGFPIGVTADLVRHQHNGFLAAPFDPAGLARGLGWVLDRRNEPAIRVAARDVAVARADVRGQVSRYLEIYRRATSPQRRDQPDGN